MPEFLERASFPDERRWQFADTVTMTQGNHTVKFGGDVNFVKDIINNLRFLGGEFNYTGATTGLSDFIVDYVNWQTNGAIRALANGNSNRAVASAHSRLTCSGWRASATPATSTRDLVFWV